DHRHGGADRYAAGTGRSDVASATQRTCRGVQPLQGLGSSRINYRLCPLVFRLHGYRRRILCNVAVEGMERPGGAAFRITTVILAVLIFVSLPDGDIG